MSDFLADKTYVYLGPLLGWVEATLSAVTDRCAEIAEHVAKVIDRPHPLFADLGVSVAGPNARASVRYWNEGADHDPGDEDRR